MCISIHLHFLCFPVPPGIFHRPQLSLCLLFQDVTICVIYREVFLLCFVYALYFYDAGNVLLFMYSNHEIKVISLWLAYHWLTPYHLYDRHMDCIWMSCEYIFMYHYFACMRTLCVCVCVRACAFVSKYVTLWSNCDTVVHYLADNWSYILQTTKYLLL